MLSILPDGTGKYAAYVGDQKLGQCFWRAEENVTVITGISLEDSSDTALLDGMIRAVWFAGLQAGRTHGAIEANAAEPFADALKRLGLPTQPTALSDLPKHCGCAH